MLVVVLSRLFARLIKFGARLMIAVMVMVVMVVVMVRVVPASSSSLARPASLLKCHPKSILLFVSPHESSMCHRRRQRKVSIRWEDLSTSLHNPKQLSPSFHCSSNVRSQESGVAPILGLTVARCSLPLSCFGLCSMD